MDHLGGSSGFGAMLTNHREVGTSAKKKQEKKTKDYAFSAKTTFLHG